MHTHKVVSVLSGEWFDERDADHALLLVTGSPLVHDGASEYGENGPHSSAVHYCCQARRAALRYATFFSLCPNSYDPQPDL